MDNKQQNNNLKKSLNLSNVPNPSKLDTKKLVTPKTKTKITRKKTKLKLWFYLIVIVIIVVTGTYGYFKYFNPLTTITTSIENFFNFKKSTPTKVKSIDKKVTTNQKPIANAKPSSSTINSNPDKDYQDAILNLSTKIDNINAKLNLKQQQHQKNYLKISNRFNLIYALEQGEAPFSLLQAVSADVQTSALKQKLQSLTNCSSSGIATISMLEKSFDTEIYQDIYSQRLKADHSILGIAKYYFSKLVIIQNFDNTTISNPNDIRIKLNTIKQNLNTKNIQNAYTTLNQIDTKFLSAESIKWKKQLDNRLTALQVIKILKTYN